MSPSRFPKSWRDVFGSHEEIVKRDFKTLTTDDLNSWIESLRPKVVIKKPSNSAISNWGSWGRDKDRWNDPWDDDNNMDWWYRSAYGSGVTTKKSEYKNTKYDDTKYSYETRGYVPKEWLTPTGSLRPAFVELAFERQLAQLFDAALARGVWITYKTESMTPEEIKNIETLVDKSPSMKNGEDFLPGPFSVKDND
jgi:hypothetical protein